MSQGLSRRRNADPITQPGGLPSEGSSQSGFAELYTWVWHVGSSSFYWCTDPPNAEGAVGIEAFFQFVSEKDRETVARDVKIALSGVSRSSFITLHPKGRDALRVRLNVVPICDRSGQVASVLGVCDSDSFLQELSSAKTTLLAQAEETARFGTWEFDVDSREAILSPHLAQMLGTAPETRLSEDQYWGKIHPKDRAAILENVTSAVAAGSPFQYVGRYSLARGAIRHHLVRGFPRSDRNGRLRSIIGIVFDFSDQNHIEGELHRLSQRLLRTRDEERRIVARELHESTGQTLAAVKMSLGRLRELFRDDEPHVQELLHSAVELAETAIREVRTLSYLMHPPMLDEAGLRSAVTWYARGFTERSGIPIQVFVSEDFGRCAQQVETTVFRIVQEALTNIHRYSGSRNASIRLTAEDGFVHAVIEDDGCGLPPVGPNNGRLGDVPLGVGIVGMRERVKQLNGNFEICSAPGRGTVIRASLPLNSNSRRVRIKQSASRYSGPETKIG